MMKKVFDEQMVIRFNPNSIIKNEKSDEIKIWKLHFSIFGRTI